MRDHKYDSMSPYMVTLTHLLAGRCKNPLCADCGDPRDTSVKHPRRYWQQERWWNYIACAGLLVGVFGAWLLWGAR